MIRPGVDRLDYGELLCPPPGYSLKTAVGTTYSLNLEVLLGVPLALAAHGLMVENKPDDGIMLLDAIRNYAARINLFCEAGNIAVPNEARPLFAFLEDCIHQVIPKKGASFHPKMWVAEYQPNMKKGKSLYRIIVMSRNLTFDRSWDLAVMMEGEQEGAVVEANKPLIDFLLYLANHQTRGSRKKSVLALAQQLESVAFKPQLGRKKYFYEYEFLPLGISEKYNTKELLGQTCHNITVISPFISKKAIESLIGLLLAKSKMSLVSRREELNKVGEETLKDIECWHLKDVIIDGEDMLEEDELERNRQDIHAKLYLKTKDSWSQLWVGSANCTDSALGLKGPNQDNVEFMIKLSCYWYQLNGDLLKKALMGEKEEENPFESWQWDGSVIEKEDASQKEAKTLLSQIVRTKVEAMIKANITDKELYDISLIFSKEIQVPDNFEIMIAPIMLPAKAKALVREVSFSEVKLKNLCLFYSVWIKWDEGSLSFVLKIPTRGMPEDRDDAIFKAIVDNRQGFFQYVAFLLGEDVSLTFAELIGNGQGAPISPKYMHTYKPVLFEKMLRAAAQNPERLYELRSVMEALADAKDERDEKIVPDEFADLFATFERAAGLKGKRIS